MNTNSVEHAHSLCTISISVNHGHSAYPYRLGISMDVIDRIKLLIEEEKLTFHIGMEIYKKRASKDYFRYNRKEFWKAMKLISSKHHAHKLPYANRSLIVRLIKYGLNPSIPIRWVLFLEGRSYLRR